MWKDFFYYSRNEQKGLVILLILVAIVIVIRIFLPFLILKPEITEDQKQFLSQVEKLNRALKEKEIRYDSLFYFNPNTVSKHEMVLLGFSSYQINSLLGYRSKVGRLYSIDDLKKVYGVDSLFISKYREYVLFEKVKPHQKLRHIEDDIVWINFNKVTEDSWKSNVYSNEIRDSIKTFLQLNYIIKSLPSYKVSEYGDEKLFRWLKEHSKPRYQKEVQVSQLELNSSDALKLSEIKGIGKVLSNRIIKYRKLLGGYININQVKEVYGISDEVYEEIRIRFFVDPTLINKIDLLNSKISEVCKHPYFNYKQTIELKNLIRKGVNLLSIQGLQFENISPEEWSKMKMYLKSEGLDLKHE